jgi:PAS domain S-box-containing protein
MSDSAGPGTAPAQQESAAWCRAALDALEDQALVGLDDEGRICTWNAAAERLTGFPPADVLGQTYDCMSAAPGGPAPTRALRGAARDGRSECGRWWRRADASLFWAWEVIKPLAARESGGASFILSVRDESELRAVRDDGVARQQREQEAEDREGRLRSELQVAEWRASFLAEASSILVASSLDFDGTVKGLARLAVSRLCDWCVVHAIDADGNMRRFELAHRDPRRERSLGDFGSTTLRARPGNPIMAVLRTGAGHVLSRLGEGFYESLVAEDEVADRLRELGGTSAMIVPLLGRGRVLGTVTLVTRRESGEYDDEDLAVAEELARRAAIAIDNTRLYREAQEANRAKADFLAIMSHELRTPLNAIMGYSDLLDAEISGPVLPKQRRQLGRIRASARHLLQLIEEILAFARMEEGGEEVVVEEVDAHVLAREALAAIEPVAAEKGLALNESFGEPVLLRTDASKVRQILVNLLSNAAKFTHDGSITLSITSASGAITFTIRDTGIGIPPDQVERVFEPFWQAESPTTRRAGGTGLGLSVSRRFARLLGGDIRMDSTPGVGTTFRVELPLASVGLQRRVQALQASS